MSNVVIIINKYYNMYAYKSLLLVGSEIKYTAGQ